MASHSAGGEGTAGGPLPPAERPATPLEGRERLADPCPQQNGQPLRWRGGGGWRTPAPSRIASHSAGGEGAAGGPLPPAERLATPLEGRGRLADPCPQQNGQPLRWRGGGGWRIPAPSRTASHSAGGEGSAGGPLPPEERPATPLEGRGRLADPCPQKNGQPLRWRGGSSWRTPTPSRMAKEGY
uniref:Uncharacterized protein n=1 Tax=Globodera rostochiensis TaxID=31243 RepID=A0A914IFV3_GLORO